MLFKKGAHDNMNKKMAKVFAWLLTCMLIFTCIPTVSLADTVMRPGQSLGLESPTGTVKAGDIIQIPAYITNPEGLMGITLKITWDPTLLSADTSKMSKCYTKPADTDDGLNMFSSLFDLNMNDADKGSFVVAGSTGEKEFDGVTEELSLGTFKFTVLPAAAGKTIEIKIDADASSGSAWEGNKSVKQILDTPINASFAVEAEATTKYTVTFKNEDTIVKSVDIEEGKAIGAEMPEDLTKDGYTFNGWFDENDVKITAETVVKGNITATAKFTKNSGDVMRPGQSLGLKSPTGTVKAGDIIQIPAYITNPEGLMGITLKITWDPTLLSADTSKMSKCYTKPADTDDGLNMFSSLFDLNMNDADKGSFVVAGSTGEKEFDGVTEELSLGTFKFTVLPAAAGKTIEIKIDADASSGSAWEGNKSVKQILDTPINASFTVEAAAATKYTVTFKNEDTVVKSFDVEEGKAIGTENMPADPTKEGHTFVGWFNEKDEKITAETVVTDNFTATAKFDVNSYQVTFEIDGTTEKIATIKYGEKIGDELPADPAKEGYVFKGWFNGEEEITKDTVVKGSFTATAKFEEKIPENFTVTFVSDGKTVYTVDILEGTTIGDANIPNDRVKDGYTFKGWFNGDEEVNADTTVTGNITVEAKFEVTPAEEIFGLGDADGSGEINGADIVLFRQKLLRRPVMVFDSSKDLYKDGEFDGNDVMRLAMYYAGLLDDSNIQITPAP